MVERVRNHTEQVHELNQPRKAARIKPGSQGVGPLSGKCFIVTGASSGIGAAIAHQLSRSGAQLFVLGRNRARLARVGAIAEVPREWQFAGDFNDSKTIAAVAQTLSRRKTLLDGIVHCAAAYDTSRPMDADPRVLRTLMKVNVEAPIALTRRLHARLKADSQVIFVNSSVVQRPTVDAAYYAATKHALRALTDSLRQQLNTSGVRVTSLFPGRTATPMQRKLVQYEGKTYEPSRLIQPADIGLLVAGLLSLPSTMEVTDVFMRPSMPPAP